MDDQEHRNELADAVVATLVEFFPKTFQAEFWKPMKPLKRGISNDILQRTGGAITQSELNLALRAYCGRQKYLDALIAGAERIDLDGRPCGQVTTDEEINARQRLNYYSQRRLRRRTERQQEQAAAAATTLASAMDKLRQSHRSRVL